MDGTGPGDPPVDGTGPGDPLDRAYREHLAAHPSPAGGPLLLQTILTGPVRRALVPLVPLGPGWDCLDLGTGYGPLAFSLAHAQPVRATGVDRDAAVLAGAREIGAALGGWLQASSTVTLLQADAEDLPLAARSFDLVTARLLFQHLPDPARVAGEMWRLLRPGGFACVFDVDDGLSLTYPPDEGPLATLESAFAAWQHGYGGDRQIGRKLATLLAGAGFAVEGVFVLPQAGHAVSAPGDPTRTVTAERLRGGREGILNAGLLDPETFDRCLAAFEAGPPVATCRTEGQIAVVARKGPVDAVTP